MPESTLGTFGRESKPASPRSHGEDYKTVGPGFFGKLPTRGDFVERRLPRSFVSGWDRWLQRCLTTSQANLGGNWLNIYLTSPVWQFAVSSGVLDENAYVGVIVPSVDKVGRYFPLSVVSVCEPDSPTFSLLTRSKDWFLEVETVLLRVLDDPPMPFEEFDAAIEQSSDIRSGGRSAQLQRVSPVAEDLHLHFSIDDSARISDQLMSLLAATTEDAIGVHSVWLTRGSEVVAPSLLVSPELPDIEQFTALLDGNWQQRRWLSQSLGAASPSQSATSVALRSAAVSDVGKVREVNEDSYAQNDAARIWIVADGLGGHQAGDIASSMVADVVGQVPGDLSLEARVSSLTSNLGLVQSNLRKMAEGLDNVNQAASTVAALLIDDTTYACVWAGDSRIYRLRDGFLDQLTRDHVDAADENELDAGSRPVTRAVGGPDKLQLDVQYGAANAGDRFLLCTDGVYQHLAADSVREALLGGTAEEACAVLHDVVLATEAADNLTALVVDVPDLISTNVQSP